MKSKIEKVVYHLHPTFKNPTRVITTNENDFLLKTNGWGEFVINAEVYLKNVSAPIKLNRYIELKA
jgi:transcription initiation factor IIF auxiliary subunit